MSEGFDHLVAVMARLRGEGGCPWDREQTHISLKPYLIEEAYEILEAIETGAASSLCEELGDLLFQVLFHAEIAKEEHLFDIEAILKTTTEKMIRRHPHVFSESGSESSPIDGKAVLARWEEIKRKEPGNQHRTSVLDGVPKTLPSLLRAQQVQGRAARVGFDWHDATPVFEKIEEEIEELREAITEGDATKIESEIGDLLFSVVNYARFIKMNSEDALRGAISRFTERFQTMESAVKKKGVPFDTLSLDEMDLLWEQAKLGKG